MAADKRRYSKEEFARRGDALVESKVRPHLTAADEDKFVAIDIETGEYELDKNEMKAADRLRPTSMATTVRVRDGKTLTTDGPFAETREQLGGYYLVEAKDLDEANAIAAKVPSARIGSIEVRPVWAMEDY